MEKILLLDNKNPKMYNSLDFDALTMYLSKQKIEDAKLLTKNINDKVLKALIRELELKPIIDDQNKEENEKIKNHSLIILFKELEERNISSDFNRKDESLYNVCDILFNAKVYVKSKQYDKLDSYIYKLNKNEIEKLVEEINLEISYFNGDELEVSLKVLSSAKNIRNLKIKEQKQNQIIKLAKEKKKKKKKSKK